METRPMENPLELKALGELQQAIAKAESLLRDWQRAQKAEAKENSESTWDDKATGWLTISHGSIHQMNHAMDCVTGLRSMMPADGSQPFPLFAHFSVIRSALEAVSMTVWILGGKTPTQRIDRHLRNIWREFNEESRFSKTAQGAILDLSTDEDMNAFLDRARKEENRLRKKYTKEIRHIATVQGIPDPTESHHLSMRSVIRGAAAESGISELAVEAMWQQLSGFSHPSSMRARRMMLLEPIESRGDGSIDVVMTGNIDFTARTMHLLNRQFNAATIAFKGRKLRPADPSDYGRNVTA